MLFLEKNFKNDNFLNGIKTKQDKIKNSNIIEKIWFDTFNKSILQTLQSHFLNNRCSKTVQMAGNYSKQFNIRNGLEDPRNLSNSFNFDT